MFAPVARYFEIMLLARAEIGWKPVNRADEIGDRLILCGARSGRLAGGCQALAHDIRFRNHAFAGFRFDLGNERLGQPHGEPFHLMSAITFLSAPQRIVSQWPDRALIPYSPSRRAGRRPRSRSCAFPARRAGSRSKP